MGSCIFIALSAYNDFVYGYIFSTTRSQYGLLDITHLGVPVLAFKNHGVLTLKTERASIVSSNKCREAVRLTGHHTVTWPGPAARFGHAAYREHVSLSYTQGDCDGLMTTSILYSMHSVVFGICLTWFPNATTVNI